MLGKVCILKNFKNLYITISKSISCNATEFFYSESTLRVIWRSKGAAKTIEGHLGTSVLGHMRLSWKFI